MSTSTESTVEESASQTKPRIIDEIKNYPVKRFIDYVGPTGLWLFLYYLFSLFMMIVLNIARIGWSLEAIFAAPRYFAELFINYGLNAGKIEADPLDQELDFYFKRNDFSNFMTSASWIFAPMIIYVLGIFLSILPASGFQQPIGDFNYKTNYLYFHQFVPFLGTGVNNQGEMIKTGAFYFLIAWLPLILSVIVGAFINKRVFKEKEQKTVNVLKIMLFNLLAGFAVGMQMATITGTVQFRFLEALKIILTSSEENTGFLYSGEYHPISILLTSWFINFIPILFAVAGYLLYANFEDAVLKKRIHKGDLTLTQYEAVEKLKAKEQKES
ncbi:MAG: hypothetical protein ACTSXO_09395 [Candidatus Heimdallarchaeota archaeon]|nr:MAG: hypothetical protein DRP02_03890 [Candidatus Gerdarchaeota archaeon]